MKFDKITRLFERETEEEFIEKVSEEVKPRTFYQENRSFAKKIGFFSYILIIFSLIAAAFGAFVVFDFSFQNNYLMIFICGFAILAFVEYVKRHSSGKVWKDVWFKNNIPLRWTFLSLLIFALSLASSGYGIYQSAQKNGPSAKLVRSNEELEKYRADNKKLEAEKERLWGNKNEKGETYYKHFDAINDITAAMKVNSARIAEIEKGLSSENQKLTSEHRDKVDLISKILFVMIILFEIGYEACIGYQFYFRYRCYKEAKGGKIPAQRGPKGGRGHVKKKPLPYYPSEPPISKQDLDTEPFQNQTTPAPESFIGRLNKKEPGKIYQSPEGISYYQDKDTLKWMILHNNKPFSLTKIKTNIAANRSKIRRQEGVFETNQKNLKRFENYLKLITKLTETKTKTA